MRNLFLVMAITIATSLFGQTRVDGQRNYTVLASSPVVTDFIGWSYDSSKEKWAGYYNTIWDSYRGNNKTPIRTSVANISRHENIVSLQVKKVSYQEDVFYVIIYTSWSGYYDYPTLNRGWHPYKRHCLLVYDEKEYMKLFSLCVGEQPTILETFDYTLDYTIKEKTVNGLLNFYFDGKEIRKQSYRKIFLKLKQEDDNTIRFAGPTPFDHWSEHFSKEYFEIKKATFKSLFIR